MNAAVMTDLLGEILKHVKVPIGWCITKDLIPAVMDNDSVVEHGYSLYIMKHVIYNGGCSSSFSKHIANIYFPLFGSSIEICMLGKHYNMNRYFEFDIGNPQLYEDIASLLNNGVQRINSE